MMQHFCILQLTHAMNVINNSHLKVNVLSGTISLGVQNIYLKNTDVNQRKVEVLDLYGVFSNLELIFSKSRPEES